LAVIREPLNAVSNFPNIYRWSIGDIISYECRPGYRYPNGETKKDSECIENNGNAQWSIRSFPDCFGKSQ